MSTQKIIQTGNQILVEQPDHRVESNWFDLSHDVKLSSNLAELTAIACMEVMPGDTWKIRTEAIVRMAPMLAPVLQRITARSEWFFVPSRIIWDAWEEFIAPQDYGDAPPALPYFANVYNEEGTNGDYLGLPTVQLGRPNPIDKISAMPHGALIKIINNWYLDENYWPNIKDDFYPLNTGDNSGSWSGYQSVYRRLWDRDYFTSALPWAQKGPSVVIPLTTQNIPVSVINNAVAWTGRSLSGTPPAGLNGVSQSWDGATNEANLRRNSGGDLNLDPKGGIGITPQAFAAGAGTINDLRTASAVQRWLEADAKGGTRYIEILKAHFNVNSSDARMNRAEYIGNTKQPIVISEVLQNSATTTTPQGNMAGHGITAGRGDNMSHYCEEYGYIIGIGSVLPTTAYFQGIPKMFNKFDRMEYGWPELANIGAQAVSNREVFYKTDVLNDAYNNGTFGYLPRYAEYRIQNNRIAGEFKSSLNYWHMARTWGDAIPPVLNTFFQMADPTMRIYAVTTPTVDHLYQHWYHDISVNRKLPKLVSPELR